jgi:hypothetical protein
MLAIALLSLPLFLFIKNKTSGALHWYLLTACCFSKLYRLFIYHPIEFLKRQAFWLWLIYYSGLFNLWLNTWRSVLVSCKKTKGGMNMHALNKQIMVLAVARWDANTQAASLLSPARPRPIFGVISLFD